MILSLETPTKTRNKRTPANMQSNPERQCRRIFVRRETHAFIAPCDGPPEPVSSTVSEFRAEEVSWGVAAETAWSVTFCKHQNSDQDIDYF